MSISDEDRAASPDASGNLVPLVLGWLVVGVPAVWGVWQVVKKSLALFAR